MTDQSDRLLKLRDFRLSEYAARAYVALLELGTTEARDVSRLARIPLAKIYSTLDQLQMRGLATAYPGTPKRFAPVPFAEFLERQRQQHLAEVESLRAMEPELVALFPMKETSIRVDDRGTVELVKGRANVVGVLRTLLGTAESSVVVSAADGVAERIHAFAPLLASARGRGVETRLLAPPSAALGALAERLAGAADVRARVPIAPPGGHVVMAVADGRMALLAHLLPDDASLTRGNDFGVVITEAGLVHALQATLAGAWEAAPASAMIVPHRLAHD